MIRGIHHTAISTPDIDRAVNFYRDIVGFSEVTRFEWSKGMKMADELTGLKDSAAKLVMLKAGNAYLEIFEYISPPTALADPDRPVCDHGISHICLDVTDVDGEYLRLKEAGVRFNSPPQDIADGIRTTYGRDPDGNIFEIQELRSDSDMLITVKE